MICNRCEVDKLITEYGASKAHSGGIDAICKECRRIASRLRKPRVPKHIATGTLARPKLTEDELIDMLIAQHNRCAICNEKLVNGKYAIDHDHSTGELRMLLCYPCNMGLGHFRDSSDLLRKAIAYLETSSQGRSDLGMSSLNETA